jgi:hypothetical protein
LRTLNLEVKIQSNKIQRLIKVGETKAKPRINVGQFLSNLVTLSYLFKIFIVGQTMSTIFNMIINYIVVIYSHIVTYSHIYSHVVLIMIVVKIITMIEVQI